LIEKYNWMHSSIEKQIERLVYIRLITCIAYYQVLSWIILRFVPILKVLQKKYDIGLYPYTQNGSDGYTRRFEEYFMFLKEDGLSYNVFDICSNDYVISKMNGSAIERYDFFRFILKKRFSQTLKIRYCKSAFIHRNLFPFYHDLKFPFLEKLAFKLCDNIVIDYWDSVWLYNPLLIEKTVQYCHKLSVVNQFIYEHFSKIKIPKVIFPIGVNLNRYIVKPTYAYSHEGSFTFFYTGLPGNVQRMLARLDPVIVELSKTLKLRLLLVSREKVEHPNIEVEHHLFDEKTFFLLLTKADIGIYAVDNSEESNGKMAMKVLDYFAAGLPCIASPYGVTPNAINKVHLLFAETVEEWIYNMLLLYKDCNYRETLGKAGHEMMLEHHGIGASYHIFKKMLS
jgi:hypothetical protein